MSDWIKHDGTCCPLPVGTYAEARLANGKVYTGTVQTSDHGGRSAWLWHTPACKAHPKYRVIAYRLPRSRAADELIERIRNLEPEKEPA